MAGLVRHVLGQRTFYPIFPPPEPHAGEVNLDVTHYPLLKMDGPAPDILILPSKLKHFSKVRPPHPFYVARCKLTWSSSCTDCRLHIGRQSRTPIAGTYGGDFCKGRDPPDAQIRAREDDGRGWGIGRYGRAPNLGEGKIGDLAYLGRWWDGSSMYLTPSGVDMLFVAVKVNASLVSPLACGKPMH